MLQKIIDDDFYFVTIEFFCILPFFDNIKKDCLPWLYKFDKWKETNTN